MDDIERINFTKLEQEFMRIYRKHGYLSSDLQDDLLALFDTIEELRDKQDKIRELAYTLAEKL